MTHRATPASRRGVRRGIYILPALLTVGNIFCGYLSLEAAIGQQLVRAAELVFLAIILDGLDGLVARMTRTTSAFGEQLDSLADVISFGVSPALLVYRWALSDFNRLGLVVSFLFVVCGAARLARFNVQVHIVDRRYFVGLPIPAAAGTLCAFVWLHPEPFAGHEVKAVFLPVTVLLSFLMVSTFRYRSSKDVDLRSRRSAILVPLVALMIGAIAYQPAWSLSVFLSLYALSGPFVRAISFLPGARAREAARARDVETRPAPAER